ncbi:hypothetical protein PoB_002646300 [Plakobranchus ocellatus]|uniref:Uncharacterized protein n=1 Tax=Plakobranchus ocellatus TaxID=259542 RepID=A0AAV3ZZT6_9GAST|nr:hypothetical protein PoB_002646300 [Plakobranchus ocellatus]
MKTEHTKAKAGSCVQMELHWRPMRERVSRDDIMYDMPLMYQQHEYDYLSSLLMVYVPLRDLQSAKHKKEKKNAALYKPTMNYEAYGQCSFHFVGRLVWDELPGFIREVRHLDKV